MLYQSTLVGIICIWLWWLRDFLAWPIFPIKALNWMTNKKCTPQKLQFICTHTQKTSSNIPLHSTIKRTQMMAYWHLFIFDSLAHDHQTAHLSLGFIPDPAEHPKSLAKSGELCRGPMMRYMPGEWEPVLIWKHSLQINKHSEEKKTYLWSGQKYDFSTSSYVF